MSEGICEVCGCTDNNACYDQPTGQVCGWADEDLCTFCGTGGPPSEVWTEEEIPELGPCCACGQDGPRQRGEGRRGRPHSFGPRFV